MIFKGIGVIPKEKKKRIILEDFHTLNTKGLYTAPHRVLFIHNKWHRRSLRCLTDTTRRACCIMFIVGVVYKAGSILFQNKRYRRQSAFSNRWTG